MGFNPACQVTGAIVPGTCDFPTEPTFTVFFGALATTGDDVQVPDGARYLDFLLVNSTAANMYGAGAPILSVRSTTLGSGVPQLVRDYTNGVMLPPYPAALSGVGLGDPDVSLSPTLSVDTTVTCDALLTFYLEF